MTGSYLFTQSPSGFGHVSDTDGYTVEFFFNTVSAPNPLLRMTGPQANLVITLDADGYVHATYGDSVVTGSTDLSDGEWHHVAARIWRGDTSAYLYVWVDGDGLYTSGASPAPVIRLNTLAVGYDGASMGDGQFAHVAITPGEISLARLRDHANAGLNSFGRETTTDRFTRLCRTAGVPTGMHDVDGTGLSTMSEQPTEGLSLLELIRQCADAEQGLSYVRSSGVLAFAPRSVRYGTPVGLTLDARTQLDTGFTLSTDDGLLVNDVTASRPGGATVRVTDNDSIEAYDLHDTSLDLFVDSDEQVQAVAEWTVHTASQPQPRSPQVTVDAVAFEAAGGDVVDLLTADIGTRLRITNLPDDVSATGTLDLFIEGVRPRFEKHGPVFTFTTSPLGASGSVWIIEDPVYGLVETGGVIAL